MHFRNIVKILSVIILLICCAMLVPLVLSLVYGEKTVAVAFVKTIVPSAAISIFLYFILRNYKEPISVRDKSLCVVLVWIVTAALSAVPYILSNTIKGFSSAFFEAMSGYTATGSSVISGVESCARSILFWRSETNWLGGIGIVVLLTAVLPSIGGKSGDSYKILSEESVGPVKGKLVSQTKKSALILYAIYIAFTLIQIICHLFEGLSLFDSVTLAFSTISTAGFSVKNASVASFANAAVENTVTVFMILGGANFALYYSLLCGRFKDVIGNKELRFYLGTFVVLSVASAVSLSIGTVYGSFGECLRHGAFSIASVLSSTGLVSCDFLKWPSFATMCVVLCMFIGGCSGSTAGGIKVERIRSLCVLGKNSIKKKIHLSSVVVVKGSDNSIYSTNMQLSIASFVLLYIMTWLAGSLVVSMGGSSIETSMAASLLSLGNIGVGFGNVGPFTDFTQFREWLLWVFSFLMLAGRLELISVYSIFSRQFWK